MTQQLHENPILEEIAILKTKFENIKRDTEDFVASAKHLSESGTKEAKELIESAKENWQSIRSYFEGSSLSSLFGSAKKPAKKKIMAKAKKAVKTAARVGKKVTRAVKKAKR